MVADFIGKELLFPEEKDFAAFFKEPFGKGKAIMQSFPEVDVLGDGRKYRAEIGTYVSIRGKDGYESMYATPTERTVSSVADNMLVGPNDSVYFEIVYRDDGALLLAKNNQIIASRWLDLLDPTTIPQKKDG